MRRALCLLDGALAMNHKGAKAASPSPALRSCSTRPMRRGGKARVPSPSQARGDQEAMALLTGGRRRPPFRARRGQPLASIQSICRCGRCCRTPLRPVARLGAAARRDGLAITSALGVINMAHGEMVMIGPRHLVVHEVSARSIRPFRLFSVDAGPLAFWWLADRRPDDAASFRFLMPSLETLLATWGISRCCASVRTCSPTTASRQSLLDERRVRTRADHHHL